MKRRTPGAEEYLEMLVRFMEKGEKPKVSAIAAEMKVSKASVTGMLRNLAKRGLVTYHPYSCPELTEDGEREGRRVLRKHRLIEKFLAFLGLKGNQVHKEACVLEHALSDEVEQALRKSMRFLGKPEIPAERVKRLTELAKGEKGTILFLAGGRSACQRLEDMGLTPGARVMVGRASSRAGPVEICVRSSCLAIGRGLAEKIFVEV